MPRNIAVVLRAGGVLPGYGRHLLAHLNRGNPCATARERVPRAATGCDIIATYRTSPRQCTPNPNNRPPPPNGDALSAFWHDLFGTSFTISAAASQPGEGEATPRATWHWPPTRPDPSRTSTSSRR